MNLITNWWTRLIAPFATILGIAGMVIAQSGPVPADQPVVSQETLLSAPLSFRSEEIQDFLARSQSPLAVYQEQVGDQSLTAADLFWITSQGETYGINPKALITTFSVQQKGLNWPQTGGLAAHLKGLAQQLAGYEAEAMTAAQRPAGTAAQGGGLPPQGTGPSAKNLSAVESSATLAVGRVLAPQAKLAGAVRSAVQDWVETYQNLFGENAAAKLVEPPPTTEPFLRLPFDQPKDDFFRVESFFDHYTPGNFTESYILRFDGKFLPGALFKNCWAGMTCYSGHNGIDYPMPTGTPLYAAAAGKVILRYDYEGGLVIDHANGYRTVYWHMDRIIVNLNQEVADGQLLGWSDNRGMSTGPHLHFVLRMSALSRDVDPYGWWAATTDPWPYPSRWMWRGGLVADDTTAQGQLFYGSYWNRDARGYNGASWWTLSVTSFVANTNFGIWGTTIPDAGSYRVYATWPKDAQNTTCATYQVWHEKGMSPVTVSQRDDGDRWVLLGTFPFQRGQAVVILTDLTRDVPSRQRVVFDAVKWEPAGNNSYLPSIFGGGSGDNPY